VIRRPFAFPFALMPLASLSDLSPFATIEARMAHDPNWGVIMDQDDSPAEKRAISIDSIANLAKALSWPAVALTAIILFYSPIRAVADSIAARAPDIRTLKLGALELNIDAKDLPKPSNATAKVLGDFTQDMILELIAIDEIGGPCFPNMNDPRYVAHQALARLGRSNSSQKLVGTIGAIIRIRSG
jgi:hypothetical protein